MAPTLAASRHFDPLRHDAGFQALVAEAEAGRQAALAAFREAGGESLLGVTVASAGITSSRPLAPLP